MLVLIPIALIVCAVGAAGSRKRTTIGSRPKAGARRAAIGARAPSIQVTYPMADPDETRAFLQEIANGTARANARILGDDDPCCAGCGGVEYVNVQPYCGTDRTCQRVLDARALLGAGEGTCIDMAAYDAGAALAAGKDARVELETTGDWTFHAVAVIDGEIHDPRPAPGAGCGCGPACSCEPQTESGCGCG